jgi:hypothetical protein
MELLKMFEAWVKTVKLVVSKKGNNGFKVYCVPLKKLDELMVLGSSSAGVSAGCHFEWELKHGSAGVGLIVLSLLSPSWVLTPAKVSLIDSVILKIATRNNVSRIDSVPLGKLKRLVSAGARSDWSLDGDYLVLRRFRLLAFKTDSRVSCEYFGL